MVRLIVFVSFSVGLLYLSRNSLKSPRSHGFYRFFAWECILGLFVLNFQSWQHWFAEPFSTRQLISWIFLFGSLVPAVLGIHMLYTAGQPDSRRNGDQSLIGIEKTTGLVTTGVYRYIRHPLYRSLLCLARGVFFKDPTWVALGMSVSTTAFLVATAKVEEVENEQYFGTAYSTYRQKTRMFVPWLF